MRKIYLREVVISKMHCQDRELSLFEGDIKEDRKYWIKYQDAISVRYFELKEVEI